jgi:hypothetical protein
VSVHNEEGDIAMAKLLRMLGAQPAELEAREPGADWEPGERSIKTPIPLGVREDGTPTTLALWTPRGSRHPFVVGASGSGKTNTLNVLNAGIVASTDTVLWIADVAKSGKSMAGWYPCVDWLVTTPEDLLVMLNCALAVIKARALAGARLAAQGRGDAAMMPRPGFPLLVIEIDETAAAMAGHDDLAAEITEKATKIAEQGREVAVSLLLATQKPTQDSLGNSGRLAAQLNPRLCLRMNRPADLRFALPGTRLENLRLEVFTTEGVLLHQDGPGADPLPERTFALYDPAVVHALGQLYASIRPGLEAASRLAMGEAYANRNRDPFGLQEALRPAAAAGIAPAAKGKGKAGKAVKLTPDQAAAMQAEEWAARLAGTDPTEQDHVTARERRDAAVYELDKVRQRVAAATREPDLPQVPLGALVDVALAASGERPADPKLIPVTSAVIRVLGDAEEPMTRKEIMDAIDKSKPTTCRALRELIDLGTVAMLGEKNNYHYQLSSPEFARPLD